MPSGGVSYTVKSDERETAGYMLKFSKSSGSEGWKKRFFVLRGSSLNYFSDQNSTKSKGELLIFGETQFKSGSENGQPFSISLWEPFSLLQLACASEADLRVWIDAFARSIALGKQSLRSIIYRRAQLQDGGTKKKFFVLHQDVITYHKDKTQLLNVQGLVHLDNNSDLEFDDSKLILTIQDTYANYSLCLQFKPDGTGENGNYFSWKAAIVAMLEAHHASIRSAIEEDADTGGVRSDFDDRDMGVPGGRFRASVRKHGSMFVRSDSMPSEGGEWTSLVLYLTDTELLCVEECGTSSVLTATSPSGSPRRATPGPTENSRVVDVYTITPNSGVFETNLGEFAFELVTPNKVLHAMPASDQEAEEWINALKEVISHAFLDASDVLLQSAMMKIDDDEFLVVVIEEKRSLGITFERAGEWAIVKAAKLDSGIPVGAVLSSVNEQQCILSSYASTIDQLKAWVPPLTLRFRQPPSKYGYLLKESKSRRDPTKKVWKKRFFVLGGGRLCYKDQADADAAIKGEFPLMGSAVSLVSPEEIGRLFCFRLISGVSVLLVQSATERQMLEWASTLYHAVAIANGGGHILRYERDRLLVSERDLLSLDFGANERDQPLAPLNAAAALAQAKTKSSPRGGGGRLSESSSPMGGNSQLTQVRFVRLHSRLCFLLSRHIYYIYSPPLFSQAYT